MPELPETLEAWIRELPEEVQSVVREKPPTICYRSVENEGHFWVDGVIEKGGAVFYIIMHGSDSFLPGCIVQPVDPDSLMPCACGKWVRPARAKIEAAERVAEAMQAALTRQSPDES